MSTFDFVIAGGGSAASVAAMRLVRDFGYRVLMLERGPRNTTALMAMPAGYMKYLAQDTFLEMHKTVPQPQLGGRAPIVPVGRALGGGSAVNAMVYMRGQAEDYDGWAASIGSNDQWNYADMLGHFRGLERNEKFNDHYHGIGGNLRVSEPGHIAESTWDFVRACQSRGHVWNADFNGMQQWGVGIMQHTYGMWNGKKRRSDAKRAFLDPLEADKRLHIVTGARVDRIIIENGRAVGVAYTVNGEPHEARAGREVLVAAGTYNTAKLLMLSGIGPADHLRDFQIPVLADLPGVGQNLQDHHEIPLIVSTRDKSGYFGQDRGWNMIRNGLQYLGFGTGPVTTTGVEACVFFDPDFGPRPTIQLYCVPTVYLDRDVSGVKSTWGVTFTACLLRPRARGWVKLRSSDPADLPVVNCNFFGDPEDLRLTLAALRHARDIVASEPLQSKVKEELLPGAAVTSDDALAAYAGRTVKTNYHPVGTAKMGRDDDPMAVVDAHLRVRGVEALRVIDCSMMPAIVSGNTNAPAMAIGSKAAALIAAGNA